MHLRYLCFGCFVMQEKLVIMADYFLLLCREVSKPDISVPERMLGYLLLMIKSYPFGAF